LFVNVAVLVLSAFTNAVVASCVVFVSAAAVGAAGIPVNVGAAMFALRFKAVCVAVETGLLASVVLSTFPNPTCALVTECGLLVLDRWFKTFVPFVLIHETALSYADFNAVVKASVIVSSRDLFACVCLAAVFAATSAASVYEILAVLATTAELAETRPSV